MGRQVTGATGFLALVLLAHLEIGAFASGFTPTADNVDQWEANWITDGVILSYQPEFWNYDHPEYPPNLTPTIANTEDFSGTLPSGADNPAETDLRWLTLVDTDPPQAEQTFYRIRFVPNSWKTFYVATNGNDANDGLSLESPFKTIHQARAEVAYSI